MESATKGPYLDNLGRSVTGNFSKPPWPLSSQNITCSPVLVLKEEKGGNVVKNEDCPTVLTLSISPPGVQQ
eukprot:scaffold27659_cov16-Tisochrysis_lutea.AAC.2